MTSPAPRTLKPSPRRRVFSLVAAAIAVAGAAAGPAVGAIDTGAAQAVFAEARAICERDAGALWGHSLCGPILLVDPTDLAVVANQGDAGGALTASGVVFVGTLPKTEILANTPIEWSGVRWTELLWPLTEDATKRQVLLAHEMFHRIQPALNLNRPDSGNLHLDTLEGRYLLQLEWRALAKALQAPDAAGRRAAVADALLFRAERHRLAPEAAAEEGSLEIAEGVPEYTGVMLGLTTREARTAFAVHDLSAFVESPSFVRSFAYATGPAWGLMLDDADPAWRGKLGSGLRLDELLGSALQIAPAAGAGLKARIAAYDDGALRTAEETREAARLTRLAVLKARLVDGPLLTLPLTKASYQFNPQTLQSLGEFGTVYPTLRVTAEWGALEVTDGARFGKDRKSVTVSAKGMDPAGAKGDGWTLTLKPGWRISPGERDIDLTVTRAGD